MDLSTRAMRTAESPGPWLTQHVQGLKPCRLIAARQLSFHRCMNKITSPRQRQCLESDFAILTHGNINKVSLSQPSVMRWCVTV